jgi:plastocyanin
MPTSGVSTGTVAVVGTTIARVRRARDLVVPLALAASLLAGSVLAGCSGSSSSGAPTTLGPNDVEVANFSFTPSKLTVKAGTTVTWHFNQPSAPHNVVSLSTPAVFNSGTPKGTGTYSFTFTTPGTYPYLCQVHPAMRGTVIVTP